jgi:hypothetical protein
MRSNGLHGFVLEGISPAVGESGRGGHSTALAGRRSFAEARTIASGSSEWLRSDPAIDYFAFDSSSVTIASCGRHLVPSELDETTVKSGGCRCP